MAGFALMLAGMALGGVVSHFMEPTAASLVFGTLVFVGLGHHGGAPILAAIRAAFGSSDSVHLVSHYHVLQSLRRLANGCGLIGALVGLVLYLSNLGGASSLLGQPIAIVLMSMLYGLFTGELLLGPLCSRLRAIGPTDADWDTPDDKRTYVLAISIVSMLLFVFFMYMTAKLLGTLGSS
ncbi:MAG: hypothetical protein CMH52_13600 [Myxococcales bacterium]|nr:hypothetical protein [Myxococcales bacterium]|tara:strand:+ start:1344 stop:1883 length:540 start_codon:yes stop_codon:yes gene_type:complete